MSRPLSKSGASAPERHDAVAVEQNIAQDEEQQTADGTVSRCLRSLDVEIAVQPHRLADVFADVIMVPEDASIGAMHDAL